MILHGLEKIPIDYSEMFMHTFSLPAKFCI